MPEARPEVTHRAGVIGSPIAHSLSPVLHRAAYQALGLVDWEYQRCEIGAGEVADFVAALDLRWSGLSVTMPGKEEALSLADEVTQRARLSGAANTLIRTATGWRADNTDIAGITMALREAGCAEASSAWIVGSGATARSSLIALAGIGVTNVYLQVRSEPRAQTVDLARVLGMDIAVRTFADPGPFPPSLDVAISTVPAGTAPVRSDVLPQTADSDSDLLAESGDVDRRRTPVQPVALDVAYYPRRSEWTDALAGRGARRVDGAVMLLHQGGAQFELMTGHRPPLQAMREALAGALDNGQLNGAGLNPW